MLLSVLDVSRLTSKSWVILYYTFRSMSTIPELSMTSLRRMSHFDASLIKAYICAGDAFGFCFLFVDDDDDDDDE